jgi:hypothetical protein
VVIKFDYYKNYPFSNFLLHADAGFEPSINKRIKGILIGWLKDKRAKPL